MLLYAFLLPLLSTTMKGLILLSLAAAGLAAPVYLGSKCSLTPPVEGTYVLTHEGKASWIVPPGTEGETAVAEKAKRVYEGSMSPLPHYRARRSM